MGAYLDSILVQGNSKSLQVLLCESQLSGLLYTLKGKGTRELPLGDARANISVSSAVQGCLSMDSGTQTLMVL